MSALDAILQGLTEPHEGLLNWGLDKMHRQIDPVRVLSGVDSDDVNWTPSWADYLGAAFMGLGTRAPNTMTVYRGSRRPPNAANTEGEIYFSDNRKIANEYTIGRRNEDKVKELRQLYKNSFGVKPAPARTWRAEVDPSGFLTADAKGKLWPIIDDSLIPVAKAKKSPGVIAKNVTDVGPGIDSMLQNQIVVLDPSRINPIAWQNLSMFGPAAINQIVSGLGATAAK